jgi:hypothetical protein
MSKAAFWLAMAFWVVMMTLLIRVDILPDYQVEENPGYRDVVKHVDAPVTRAMAVFQGDEEVGTSHTVITPASDGSVKITNFTSLAVHIAVFESRVNAVLDVTIDPNHELDKLDLTVSSGDKHANVKGRRRGDRVFLDADLNGNRFAEEIPYQSGMISSYFEPFGFGAELKVGQKWHTRLLDPLEQKTVDASVEVVGKETINLSLRDGEPPKPMEAYHVVMRYGTIMLNAWATQNGVVLKEETPLGYTLVYREADDK